MRSAEAQAWQQAEVALEAAKAEPAPEGDEWEVND